VRDLLVHNLLHRDGDDDALLLHKETLDSRIASLENSKITKNPFSHFARRVAVSKASIIALAKATVD